jgi:hypothetical protein
MAQYTIELTTTQDLALSSVVADQHDWISNFINDRCRIAIDDIVKICVEQCLATGTQIPSTKDEMVSLAFEKGWVAPLANNIPVPQA